MSQIITQVDAFTNQAFKGNPAAVCILAEAAEVSWMEQVAAEMNLAETAFLYKAEDGYNLRWFTPAVEVDLCGHATLATAHVLWEAGYLAPQAQARFYTKSGLLTATKQGDWIELDFPALTAKEAPAPVGLLEALGISSPRYVGISRFDYLIEVESEAEVLALQPDFTALKRTETRGSIVTSRASRPGFDFISRFFAPAAGINEDPVTGSAHCVLTPYWSKRLGQTSFMAYQASARGGILKLNLNGERVGLGGQAVTVLRGELV
jgi:PhzF family phenazine biosynthesis protein